MNLDHYQELANRTAKVYETTSANLIHAALGIATEGGEFTTEVKRHAIYEKNLTPEMQAHMIEELGDLMWYIALAAHHLETPLSTICRGNINKLFKRYPEKYSDLAAEGRADKDGQDARSS